MENKKEGLMLEIFNPTSERQYFCLNRPNEKCEFKTVGDVSDEVFSYFQVQSICDNIDSKEVSLMKGLTLMYVSGVVFPHMSDMSAYQSRFDAVVMRFESKIKSIDFVIPPNGRLRVVCLSKNTSGGLVDKYLVDLYHKSH